MERRSCAWSRRQFLRQTGRGLAAAGAFSGISLSSLVFGAPPAPTTTKRPVQAGLTHGDSRADNIFKALKLVEGDIRLGLARKKRVVIKPNMVVVNNPLASTHVGCIEGICEFFGPLVQEEIIIAESPANGPAAVGYSNYRYEDLKKRYRVRFVDLDEQPLATQYVVDERFHPKAIRFSQFLMDPDAYVVSAAVFKTHDRAITTLSLKNLVVGAMLKDRGYHWGAGSKGTNDKWWVHGGPKNQGIHYNLFTLAKLRPPDLSVLDGFQGMEGNGPCSGTAVDHKVAVASTDWVAADSLTAHLMGFDPRKIGYLVFGGRAGLGEPDLGKVEVLGQRASDHVRAYKPHDSIQDQYRWIRV